MLLWVCEEFSNKKLYRSNAYAEYYCTYLSNEIIIWIAGSCSEDVCEIYVTVKSSLPQLFFFLIYAQHVTKYTMAPSSG